MRRLLADMGMPARELLRQKGTPYAELGLDDYREGAALLAEGPDHAGGFAHEPNCLAIALEKVGEGREAVVTPGTSWQSRWP